MLLSLNAFTLLIVLGIVGGVVSLTTVVAILIAEKEIDYFKVEKKRAELEGLLKESQFLHLSSQIRPHFLFNTLNVISALIRLDLKKDAEQATISIASLLRYHLKDRESLISLQEELEYVRHYLTIQKLRFGKKLNWEIQVDPELLSMQIPLLSIQPLVENSCVHGIEKALYGGSITVSVQLKENRMDITVKDDGVGISQDVVRQFEKWKTTKEVDNHLLRIGLKNVHSRLAHLFGDQSGLTIHRLEHGTMGLIQLYYKETSDESISGGR
jgi:sensor histidine kinase YesM